MLDAAGRGDAELASPTGIGVADRGRRSLSKPKSDLRRPSTKHNSLDLLEISKTRQFDSSILVQTKLLVPVCGYVWAAHLNSWRSSRPLPKAHPWTI